MGEPKTYREIAALLGLSYQRVQQLEARALRKMRAMVEEREQLPPEGTKQPL